MSPSDQQTASGALPPLAEDRFDVGSTPDSLDRLVAAAAISGDIFRIHAPDRKSDTWIVNNPADIKRVLVTNHHNYTKGIGLDRVKILLGNGIMTSEGRLWRAQRRMIQPLFHRRVIERFIDVIERAVDERTAHWQELAQRSEVIDVTEEMSELTLNIVVRSIFGTDLDWLTARTGTLPFQMVTEESARNLQFAYKFRSLTRLVGELVAKRRAAAEDHFDFLGMLMAARDKDTGEPMPDRELLDETMTLIVAGHETTASSLNWMWYLLATHPEAAARLHAEVDALPSVDQLTFQQTEALRYTQAVIQEAMRLYPPGWVLTRRTIEADTLSGYTVPAGTNVMLSPYLIQRHPAHWEAPDEFRPERFLDPARDPRAEWVYIPFAAGPRHCVGENLAMYEMTVHLARVARHWRLEYVDEGPIGLEAAINLRSRRNLKMRLIARDNARAH
jgi:cytochrome P450